MKKNIINNTMIAGAITLAIAGCSDVEEGRDYGFSNDEPVVYSSDPFTRSFSEESGNQVIDLLEGSTVGGVALDVETFGSPIFIREVEFVPANAAFETPQLEGNARNQTISPFSMDETGTKLVVNTDQFADAIRMCDTTDARGGPLDANGAPTADGVRDFPQSISYDVSYIVDVGHELAPGAEVEKRTLTVTINSITDPVTEVTAFDVSVASGEVKVMPSATEPSYACNTNLTYSISDDSFATIDASGNLTGAAQGTTMITVSSEENPSLSATAEITVTPGFNIGITNQDFNDLNVAQGTKSVPTCSPIGVEVQPTIISDELTGDYTFDWQSSSADAVFSYSESNGNFGAFGRFSNTLEAGETADITVAYDSGYIGATLASDIASQTVTVTAERNYACDPNANANGDVWYASDLLMESGGWGPDATHVAEGIDGNALQFTIPEGGQIRAAATQQQWNQVFNFHAATYGRGDASVGRQFKFAVWAKLKQLPADADAELKIDHTVLAWNCDGCTGLTNFPARYDAGLVSSVSATLKHTTDWQLVELINPLTGTAVWEVPAHFNVATAAFQFWDFYGFAQGDQILLDQYSVVEVE